MSTSTIENIAIGVRSTTPTNTRNLRDRRNASKKTRRRISFALDDIISPAHPRAWQASLKESFTNRQAFDIILQDIGKLDSEFTEFLEINPHAFTENPPPSSFSSLTRYQEYVDAFISLFAQSTFDSSRRGGTENEITESLYGNRCPRKKIFRRLVVNPFYIAEENPESSDRIVLDCGSIPTAQLARMCDISILKFLSTVTEKTNIHSVVWALDYLAEMTKRLIERELERERERGREKEKEKEN